MELTGVNEICLDKKKIKVQIFKQDLSLFTYFDFDRNMFISVVSGIENLILQICIRC